MEPGPHTVGLSHVLTHLVPFTAHWLAKVITPIYNHKKYL